MRLVVDNLACDRGGRRVLEGLSFEARGGEAVLLRGPNGAGKSTLLRVIAGLLDPAAGTVRLESEERTLEIADHCHYVGHLDAVKPAFTVRETTEFWSRLLGGDAVSAEPALARFGMAELADVPCRFLSAGQKRRLSLSRLLLARRGLWLLDEPTTALDAERREALDGAISEHIEAGGIVIAATHEAVGPATARALWLNRLESSAA